MNDRDINVSSLESQASMGTEEFMVPPHILDILLSDRTTGKNIVWGTDGYGYAPESEILAGQICSGEVIMPRFMKSPDTRKSRTKSRAEVFTPTGIVGKMNDYVDDDVGTEEYIRRKVLEVTCGEAPYLVSRYDPVTGESISLSFRQGLLDRKMRRINGLQVTKDREHWKICMEYALKSTYGYEWSGDSLLLARINVLYDITDWYEDRFNEAVPDGLLTDIADIISYNIFQMDGVTMCVPYTSVPVMIMDWDADEFIRFDGKPVELSLF